MMYGGSIKTAPQHTGTSVRQKTSQPRKAPPTEGQETPLVLGNGNATRVKATWANADRPAATDFPITFPSASVISTPSLQQARTEKTAKENDERRLLTLERHGILHGHTSRYVAKTRTWLRGTASPPHCMHQPTQLL